MAPAGKGRVCCPTIWDIEEQIAWKNNNFKDGYSAPCLPCFAGLWHEDGPCGIMTEHPLPLPILFEALHLVVWLLTGFCCGESLPCSVQPVSSTFVSWFPCLVVERGWRENDQTWEKVEMGTYQPPPATQQMEREDAHNPLQARRNAEEQARKEAAERSKREAEKKLAAKREAEAKARREAEAKARREAEAKARREAEEKARKEKAKQEAEEEWSRLQNAIADVQGRMTQAAQSLDFDAAKQLKQQLAHFEEAAQKGGGHRKRASSSVEAQRALKQQLEELHHAAAMGPMESFSQLRRSELDLLHHAPFDPENDVPFRSDIRQQFGNRLQSDEAMKWVSAVRMVKELSERSHKKRWTLQEIIGVGGMGVVVKAYDKTLKRPVALKVVIPSGQVFGNDEQKRLKRERLAMQRVNHPSIVRFFDSFFDKSKRMHFMVIELAEGISLQQRLQSHGPMAQQQLLEVGTMLFGGLDALHASNIVHLDVKPHNIIVVENPATGSWTIKLIDFGLARAPERQGEAGVHSTDVTTMHATKSQSIAGTLRYMPPEQLAGDKPLDFRSDIFAAGITLYQLGCDDFPHRGKCQNAVVTLNELHSWAHTPPPSLSEKTQGKIGQAFAGIIAQALAYEPKDRYQTAAQMLTALAELEDEVDFGDLLKMSSLAPASHQQEKFCATTNEFRAGDARTAAHGLEDHMGISQNRKAEIIFQGVDAIREEFTNLVAAAKTAAEKQEARANLAIVIYVLDKPANATEDQSNDGHSSVTRDKDRQGMFLADFVKDKRAVKAKLMDTHVAALRIYSSNAYRQINDPLRKGTKPHPCAATTYFIHEAIGRLRAVHANEATETKVFWRGMKNLKLTDNFRTNGGTELACMSTSTNKEVVAEYAKSDQPLIFRVVSTSFLNRGADIKWLSLYAHEDEILYPPLTYLKYLGQKKIKNSRGIVVDVEPVL